MKINNNKENKKTEISYIELKGDKKRYKKTRVLQTTIYRRFGGKLDEERKIRKIGRKQKN